MAKKHVSTLLHSHHPLALLFPLKKEHVHLYAHQKGSKTPGKQHSPLVLPFLWKKNVCIFIHVLHQVKYVHTWELKKRGRMGEKAVIYGPPRPSSFGFSLSPAIKNVHTYPHTKRGRRPLCILIRTRKGGRRPRKGRKKKRRCADMAPSTLSHFLLLSCADMGNEKEMKKWRKRRELHHFGATFLWLFSFPCNKKCASIRTSKCTERGEECVHTWWMKKRGRRGEKADVLPAH